ncbi:hypothetical protein GCM10008929_18280 [Alkalibacterium psychrotolerans]
MTQREPTQSDELFKLAIMLILAYFVPIAGIGFAIYLILYARNHTVEKWIPILAWIALVVQVLPVILAIIAFASFVAI